MSVPADDGREGLGRHSVEAGAATREPGRSEYVRGEAQVPDPDPSAASGGVQVARLFGVPIFVQPWWLAIAGALLTIVVQPRAARWFPGFDSYVLAFTFAVLLYVSVLVHELSHSVVALRLGMRVRRISLQLLGGVSEIEEEAQTPGKEFAVAFAGPALSFVVFGAAYVLSLGLDHASVAWWLASSVAGANLVVGVFNLLPGLPLDGGRVLQAAVWRGTGSRHTGVVAGAWGGRVLALALLLGLPLLMSVGVPIDLLTVAWSALIAAFLWTGAGSTLRVAHFRARLPQLRARALARKVVAVDAGTTVEVALRRSIIGRASGMVVVDAQGVACGLVNDAAVRAMPQERRAAVAVIDVARRLDPSLVLSVDAVGETLLRALQLAPATEYLLVDADGHIAGILLADDVERATSGW